MNKDRYRVLRNGKPIHYKGENITIVGKDNAQDHIDRHNAKLGRVVYTIEKVEE